MRTSLFGILRNFCAALGDDKHRRTSGDHDGLTRADVAIEPDASGQSCQMRFSTLAEAWRRQRGPSSSFSKLVLQPAYQQIIGMGPAAVPLILAELRREPDQWFWALRAITGEDPVPAEHAGDVAAMADDWLSWGAAQGYIDAGPRGASLSKTG